MEKASKIYYGLTKVATELAGSEPLPPNTIKLLEDKFSSDGLELLQLFYEIDEHIDVILEIELKKAKQSG